MYKKVIKLYVKNSKISKTFKTSLTPCLQNNFFSFFLKICKEFGTFPLIMFLLRKQSEWEALECGQNPVLSIAFRY